MAAKIRRQYAGAAAQTSITSAITAGDTSVSVASTTGWPSTASVPFYVVIDPDTSVEEKCSVTISGSTLTLTRGVDGTVAAAHASGATIYPVFTATDADEANELASKFTAKGDLVAQGSSTFTTVTVGSNGQLLKADSSAGGGVSWATYSPTITLGGDLSGSVTLTDLASGTLTATVAANSVALGTDTTGNYVATIAGTSNQVTVSGSGSESAAVTLSTPQDIHTGATPTFAGAILSGSSSGDLLRITQTGAGNALLVEDSTNPDSTPFLIDASGRAILGHTASIATGGVNQLLQVHHTVANVFLSRWIANASGSELRMGKSRSATIGSYSAVSASDVLATINGYGDDGTEFILAGNVAVRAEGTISTGVVPGRLEFGTANSSGVNTERMRIDSSGNFGMGATTVAGRLVNIGGSITGGTTAYGVFNGSAVQSDVTSVASIFISGANTAAAAFTLTTMNHFHASGIATPGSGSTITTQIGFNVGANLTGGTNNYGFYGNIASGTNRYNLYMGGTAANYMLGRLGVGATLTSGAMAQVTNTTAADKALVVKGAASQSGTLLEIQNSAGTALSVVDSSGRFVVGSGTAVAAISGVTTSLQVLGSSAATASANINRYSADSNGPGIYFGKSRNTTVGSHTVSTAGDRIGNVYYAGSDGTNFVLAANIAGETEGTISSGVVPGRMLFFTANSSGTLTERLRIDSAGNILTSGMVATTSSAYTLHMGNGTAPTANPTGGGVLYVESGALKYRGSSGTVTTIANA